MSHAINLSKPKIIFVSSLNLEKISSVAKKNSFVKQVILFDYGVADANWTKSLSFERIVESVDNRKLNEFKCEPQNMKENVALIMCSSGTTGLPKGVQLTQFNIFAVNFQAKLELKLL